MIGNLKERGEEKDRKKLVGYIMKSDMKRALMRKLMLF